MLGNKNDLKTYYESILSIDPNNTSAHYKMGVFRLWKERLCNALTHFEK